jgi:hypothetical protein
VSAKLFLSNPSPSYRAGQVLSGNLQFTLDDGTPCKAKEENFYLLSEPIAAISTDISGVSGSEVLQEKISINAQWDRSETSYRVNFQPKYSGLRKFDLLRGDPLSRVKTQQALQAKIEPADPFLDLWFRKTANSFQPILSNQLRILDFEELELSYVRKDLFGNLIERVSMPTSIESLSLSSLERLPSSDDKILKISAKGNGDELVNLSLTNMPIPLKIEIKSTLKEMGDLKLWAKADSLLDNLNEGDLVEEWQDSSPNATENLVATNAVMRPTFRTHAIGGMPALQFEGAHQMKRSSLNFGASSIGIFVVYAAWGHSGITNGSRLVSNGHHGWNTGYFIGVEQNSIVGGIGGSSKANSTLIRSNDPAVPFDYAGSPRIAATIWNVEREELSLWIDGHKLIVSKEAGSGGALSDDLRKLSTLEMNSLSTNNAHEGRGFRIGAEISGWDLLRGYIAEVAIFNSGLNDAQIGQVFKSLSKKYSIPLID